MYQLEFRFRGDGESRLKLAGVLRLRHPWRMNQLPIDLKLDRAQRLLRMIEQDAPLLEIRVASLSREHQQSAKSHAKTLAELTRAEIQKLRREKELANTAQSAD